MKGLVVGGGSIGARHLRNLEMLGGISLALVEPDVERLAAACQRGATGFGTLTKGLDWQPDFVVIASPSHLHVEQALEVAHSGCHLFVEKPLSHNWYNVPELLAEVDKRGLVSLVGCNMRFHPGPAMVKRLLEAGEIGDPIAARVQTGSFLPRWKPNQDYRNSYSASPKWGGAILDCIHELDLALWYFGPAEMLAAAHLPASAIGLFETDGLAEIILHHNSGVLTSVHLNFVQRDYHRSCQVIGSHGTIYWDFREHRVWVCGSEGELKQAVPEPEDWETNQMYLDELRHFLKSVQIRAQTVNPVSGGAEALKIALKAKAESSAMRMEEPAA